MSMLTGLRPHEQECWTNDDILDSAHPTWLHGLGAAGYAPVLIGRMHALGPDQLRGYVARPIGDHSPAWPGVARSSLGVLARTSGPFKASIEKSGPGQTSYQLMDDEVLEASVAFLRDHAASGTDEPFCLSASFMLPHPPYVAHQDDYNAVKDRVPPPTMPDPLREEHPWIKTWMDVKGLANLSQDDVQRARRSYYALVRQLDRAIGRLLDTVREIGATENTLIAYVSDHGDHIGERGLFWKHTFYEDAIKVPLILLWPAKIKHGQVCNTPVETGGLGNTILSLIGSPPLPNSSMQGFSDCLEGFLTNSSPVFIEYCTDDMPAWAEGFAVQQRAVVRGDYKYVYYHGYEDQLFDLKSDPLETSNLVNEPEYADIAGDLHKIVLQNWNRDIAKSL